MIEALTLQEIRGPPSHPRVYVSLQHVSLDFDIALAERPYLGGFDMIVKVVSEGLDVGDGFMPPLGCEMSGKKH